MWGFLYLRAFQCLYDGTMKDFKYVLTHARIDFMLTGKHYRMTFQLFNAEQLRAQQFSILVATQRIPRIC